MAVYACAKGTPLAQCNASVGKLICMQRPVYGGSGAAALNGTRFDEPGYIAIPDCFWGDRAYGLEPPQNLSGVPLHMVKTSNATYGHYGESAPHRAEPTPLHHAAEAVHAASLAWQWRADSRGCIERSRLSLACLVAL
jgi:hypothetical protein